ncbi:NUDIX domain-containing protein [Kitasatospora sp. NPDC057904]|uniref:NUDIX domain-containing protein n=1 Tax=unclassified Kitasatospora TaxID=2633591 RepID=UPI0036DF42B3
MTEPKDWLPRAQWLAGLPLAFTVASALVTDHRGRVLLVKASYRLEWSFPGGIRDRRESPAECAARELREETGLQLPAGGLLAISWADQVEESERAAASYLFYFGAIEHTTPITLPADGEITDYDWALPADVEAAASRSRGDRLRAALTARKTGVTEPISAQKVI